MDKLNSLYNDRIIFQRISRARNKSQASQLFPRAISECLNCIESKKHQSNDLVLMMNNSCFNLSYTSTIALISPQNPISNLKRLQFPITPKKVMHIIQRKTVIEPLTNFTLVSKKQMRTKEVITLNKVIHQKGIKKISSILSNIKATRKLLSLKAYENDKSNFTNSLFNPRLPFNQKKHSLESFIHLYSNPHFVNALFHARNSQSII